MMNRCWTRQFRRRSSGLDKRRAGSSPQPSTTPKFRVVPNVSCFHLCATRLCGWAGLGAQHFEGGTCGRRRRWGYMREGRQGGNRPMGWGKRLRSPGRMGPARSLATTTMAARRTVRGTAAHIYEVLIAEVESKEAELPAQDEWLPALMMATLSCLRGEALEMGRDRGSAGPGGGGGGGCW